jgi:hypothetical protein
MTKAPRHPEQPQPRAAAAASSEPRAAHSPERGSAPLDRRAFMGAASKVAVTAAVVSTLETGWEGSAAAKQPHRPDVRHSPLDRDLVTHTFRVRSDRAAENYAQPLPRHQNNGDEARYPNKIGSDTRGLPHDQLGEVDLTAWRSLIHALTTQEPDDFERVILGGTRKLVQPLGTLAVNLTGLAPAQHAVPPAPALASAEKAAEAVEAYWQALLRDVPFHQYRNDTSHPLVLAAVAELQHLSGYTGPRDASGDVTPELLFRGTGRSFDPTDPSGRRSRSFVPAGVTVGPYISQFILRDIPYSVQNIPALLQTQHADASNDFLTNYEEWLANQDGRPVTRTLTLDPVRRYLSTGRDLAEYAHGGAPAFWGASQLLGTSVAAGGLGAPFNPTHPYLSLTKTAAGFATFALPYIQSFLPLSSSREIRASYWQKWFVHRSIRPEAYGGLVHNLLTQGADYPLHDDILSSEALDRSYQKYGTFLLSSAYPEGAPNHGSYPGGASSIGSINATLLKAFFDESFVIPNPVEPDPADPTRLIPYVGPPLTVGGELNKLATNLGQGRNWAGIHWRSDAAASLPQAEEVALALLRDEKATYREPFRGFEFTRFDGTPIVI